MIAYIIKTYSLHPQKGRIEELPKKMTMVMAAPSVWIPVVQLPSAEARMKRLRLKWSAYWIMYEPNCGPVTYEVSLGKSKSKDCIPPETQFIERI